MFESHFAFRGRTVLYGRFFFRFLNDKISEVLSKVR